MSGKQGVKKLWNYCGGPSSLFPEVLQEAHESFFNVRGTGHSMFEFNHRHPEYYSLQTETKDLMRGFLKIPTNY